MTPEILFRALADPTRLRCLMLLQRQGELCVCELTHALDLSQPKISRHLATLREMQVVRDRRDGLWVFYQINPDLPEWAKRVLTDTVQGAGFEMPYCEDVQRLTEMSDRPRQSCKS